MGTNYYFNYGSEDEVHIGKRSAAGWYCWDCGVSLMNHVYDKWEDRDRYGEQAVHFGKDNNWLSSCPICDGVVQKESIGESSSGRELGFNTSKPKRKTGVKSCSSFGWAISPLKFQEMFKDNKNILKDEYEDLYNKEDFIELLKECPINNYDSVGTEFS